MDLTEELLLDLPPRHLDIAFAEVVCGLEILLRNPYNIPGLVADPTGLIMVPRFSRDAALCAIECIHDRGFEFVRMAEGCFYRCVVSRNGWELADVCLPLRRNSMRVLLIAAILAAQSVSG